MSRQTISRIFVAFMFIASVMIVGDVTAQTGMHPSTSTSSPQTPSTGGTSKQAPTPSAHPAAQSNPACQKIVSECKNLGFIPGQWKKDNGLWKDCFDPVVKGVGSPTRDGKPINVPVSASDVQACRTAVGHHK